MELLQLKAAMSNAPQAQLVAAQFAVDAQEIHHLLREFNTTCSHIHRAQETLANSYLQMSKISRLIGSKTFISQRQNLDFENTCLQFSSFLEELSVMHRAEAEELHTALFLPAHKLPSQPGLQFGDNSGTAGSKANGESAGEMAAPTSLLFSDLLGTKRYREACEKEVHVCLSRYMHLSRRCEPKEHDDTVLELARRRRILQKATVIYHARLNAAHFERQIVPLNAFFGFLTTVRNHYKKITAVVEQPSLAQFADAIKSHFECQQVQSTQATGEFLDILTNLQDQSLAVFAPEPLFAKSDMSYLRTPQTNLLSKSGHLFMRVKKTFGADWNEIYCFTEGGKLLSQQQGDPSVSVLVDGDGKNVFAEPVDIDDRRYTFQIVSVDEKSEKKPRQQQELNFISSLFSSDSQQRQTHIVVLQAENSTDRDEWIHTISNIIQNANAQAVGNQLSLESQNAVPQSFVLVPQSPSHLDEGLNEEGDLKRALQASLSCDAWIVQAPVPHLELLPVSDATAAADVAYNSESKAKLTFVGCMPLPSFLVNQSSVEKIASHVLSKRSMNQTAPKQTCVVQFTSNSILLLSASTPSVVLGHFKIAQIVHCAEVIVDSTKNDSRHLFLLTSGPHPEQWSDLTSGELLLCHFFEIDNPSEFAERVLNLQLMRLAALNETGDSPEKAHIMENVVHSFEWNLNPPTQQPPPIQALEASQKVSMEAVLIPSDHQNVPDVHKIPVLHEISPARTAVLPADNESSELELWQGPIFQGPEENPEDLTYSGDESVPGPSSFRADPPPK